MKKNHLQVLAVFLFGVLLCLGITSHVGAVSFQYPDSSVFSSTYYGDSWDNPKQNVEDVLKSLYAGEGLTLMNVNGFSGETETWFASGAVSVILEEIAGYAGNTTLGWYNATNISDSGQLFSGEDSIGDVASIAFSEPKSFGFYIDPNGVMSNRMYTEHALNANKDYQVVIFQIAGVPNQYILGWEDLPLRNSDKDFQDLIVRVTIVNPVPEPATMLLLGSGLIGLAAVGRRNFLKK